LHRRLVSLLVLIASMLLQSADAAATAKLPVPGSGVSATEIERRIDAMTPEQRVGQLLIVCFDGPIVDKGLREMVRDWGVGGVIFYRINIRSAEQTRKLTASIRMMAVNEVVPFIAIDHEGGTVIRLRDGVPELPSSMALGATGSSELAFQAGNETGAALRQLGFTMNLAPVLDVYGNPASAIGTRAFSDRPEVVARLGSAFIEGESSAGLISVAKHFIGEGEAAGDSHNSAPSVSRGMAEIEQSDLVPFRDAFTHGLSAVMLSNVAAPSLTGEGSMPVMFSRTVVTNLLREKLKFEGVAITDALEMRGIHEPEKVGKLAVEAIEAGADMVLISGAQTDRRIAFHDLLDASHSGRISEDRIRLSLRRILRLKAEFQTSRPSKLRGHRRSDVASQIATQSITLIDDPNRMLPILKQQQTRAFYVGPDGPLRQLLGLRSAILPRTIPAAELRKLVSDTISAIGDAAVIVGAAENGAQAAALLLIAAKRPEARLIAISLGNPHDLEWAQPAAARIAAYSTALESQRAVAAVLRGEAIPRGVLPVAFNGRKPQSQWIKARAAALPSGRSTPQDAGVP